MKSCWFLTSQRWGQINNMKPLLPLFIDPSVSMIYNFHFTSVYCLPVQAAQIQLALWTLTHPLHVQPAAWTATGPAHPLHVQLSPWAAAAGARLVANNAVSLLLLHAAQTQLPLWAPTQPLQRQLTPWDATRVQLLQAHPFAWLDENVEADLATAVEKAGAGAKALVPAAAQAKHIIFIVDW